MKFRKHRPRIGHSSFERKPEADLRTIAELLAVPKIKNYMRKRKC
ncbi:MAG: hypothetical protein ABGY96_04995 [bacterium]